MEPLISLFLLIELLASPHLYPSGYLAQLGIIVFLCFHENQTKAEQQYHFYSKLHDLINHASNTGQVLSIALFLYFVGKLINVL